MYEKGAQTITTACAKCLLQDDGKSVTIILDGCDEFPEHLQQSSSMSDIIRQKIMPACALVISSHPNGSRHLYCNVTSRIEILGFVEDNQVSFIKYALSKALEIK